MENLIEVRDSKVGHGNTFLRMSESWCAEEIGQQGKVSKYAKNKKEKKEKTPLPKKS